MFEWLGRLNDQQRAAVEHGNGALLILAGAGTGKTGTLACRLAYLIETGADPGRICLLTFTRRAAQEMLSRAARYTTREAAGQVWGGTFHAVANRVLRLHGRRLGLDQGFTVMDQGDAASLMGLVRHEVLANLGDGNQHGPRFPRAQTLTEIYSRVVNTGASLSIVLETSFPWCRPGASAMPAIFAAYVARKREQHLLDFDDLLLCWRALEGRPPMWDHVLVDEYQDTNAVQADILAGLCPSGRGLTVVGDDAQAIYAFRAATAGNLMDFSSRFRGATTITLSRNYRSTTPILAMANAVMASAVGVLPKTLWSTREGQRRPVLRTCEDEATQATAVCDSVLAHREMGVELRSQVVLFRAGHHADLVELELTRRNVPYVKYGGLKFLEAAHVKDLLALLRLLDNPFDELAWFRVLQLLDGVGPGGARRIMDSLGVRRLVGRVDGAGGLGLGLGLGFAVDAVLTPVARLLAASPRVPVSAQAEMAGLRAALGDCCDRGSGVGAGCGDGGGDGSGGGGGLSPAGQLERLRAWLAPVVERRYDRPSARLADLDQLVQAAGAASSRSRFVTELTLDPPVSTGDLAGPPTLDEDWLVLSTVHSAKGGEWDVVHVLHAADGMFPSDLATGDPEGIEEERRLFYVAVTRARDVLEVNVPFRFHHRPGLGDAHSYAQASRFLSPEVRATMDTAQVGRLDNLASAVADAPGRGASGLTAIDGWLADLWH
jgi:DNA helicase-2/ATP-dependent DNA helicase PcrA